MKTQRSLALVLALAAALASRANGLVEAVDPLIGAVTYPEREINNAHGFGKTFPGATSPFGMVQLSPDTITGGDNGPGYSYSHRTIEGFSFTHLSGIGWYGEFGNLQVMPSEAISAFSHARETAKAGYYSVFLDDCRVRAELTANGDVGVIRFTYPENPAAELRIDLARRIGELSRAKRFSSQELTFVSDREFTGRIRCDHRDGGWGRGEGLVDYTLYFRAHSSKPLADRTLTGGGTNLVLHTRFPTKADERVELEVRISFDGVPAPFEPQGFDAVRRASRAAWDEAFSRLSVEGGTPRQRTIFATALYHAMIDPRAVGRGDGWTRRTVFSGWDVFRSEFPLLTLVRPDVVSDTINSMSDVMARGDRDTLPVWDIFGCKSGCMIGNPLIPVIADAYEKGIRTFDAEKVWRQCVETSRKRGNADCGWTPGSLSMTLEYCYDDWCMGRFAEMLGKSGEAARYYGRAKWYTNCWDRSVGWMRSRNADGSWLVPWKGREKHGQGCVESNPWQQGWFVPHDVGGLAALMGGKTAFTAQLEEFFGRVPRDFGWNDAYNHANEPCHTLPFLFAFSDKPQRTTEWTHAICERAYGEGPYGLCGNEDVGQMSAWYVLAAIGLNPGCPGDGRWILTEPLFDRVTVKLDPKYFSGGSLEIVRTGGSASATLNGRRLDRPWVTSAEVNAGGLLEIGGHPRDERRQSCGSRPASAEPCPLVSFLALTGRPTEEELVRKVAALHRDGVDQFVMYGRSGLAYEYLGEDWMRMLETLCREASRRGMKAWLYDEFCWPSGSCNGRITRENREWRLSDMGVFGNPDGSFRWERGYVKNDVSNVYSPEATDRFIELTHEAYFRRLKPYFEDGTIPAIFTDEPGTPSAMDWKDRPLVQFAWWEGLEKEYAAARPGHGLRADVEAFLRDETKAEVWSTYSDLKGRRFASAYFGRINDWCRKVGIRSTGHLTEELSMVGGPIVQGDLLKVLKGEMLPGMDEIFTNTSKDDIEWITLAAAQHAVLRNGAGGLVELFALGPNDMSPARMRQMIWLEAIHNVDTYLASMDVMDHLGLKEKHGYISPVQEGQPWHRHFRVLGDEARKAARFARKTAFRCEVAVRYPQKDAAINAYRRHRGAFGWNVFTGPELRPLLAEIRARQLDCDLIEEAEAASRTYVFKVVADGYVEERSGMRFKTAREASDWLLARIRRRVTVREADGTVADHLMLREYEDGSLLLINLKDAGVRFLVAEVEGARTPFELSGRGVLALEKGERFPETPVACPQSLGRTEFCLSTDRDNLHRVVFDGKGIAKLKVGEAVKGARFAINTRPDVRTVELDGKPLAAARACMCLPVEYVSLYRETEPVDLEAGEHVLRLASGPADLNYFLPVALVAGRFAVRQGVLLAPIGKAPVAGPLESSGLDEFVGEITYSATVTAPDVRQPALRIQEGLDSFVRMRWNGTELGVCAWAPGIWELPPSEAGRKGRLEIVVSTAVANMLGDPDAVKYKGLWRAPRERYPSAGLRNPPEWVALPYSSVTCNLR